MVSTGRLSANEDANNRSVMNLYECTVTTIDGQTEKIEDDLRGMIERP